MTLEEIQIDPVVYLLQDCADDAEIERHIRCYCAGIFEEQLDGWITGDTLWPIDRTFDVFTRWFAVSFHSMVFDVK